MAAALLGKERGPSKVGLGVPMERFSESAGDASNLTLCAALDVTSVDSAFVKQIPLRGLYRQKKKKKIGSGVDDLIVSRPQLATGSAVDGLIVS